MLNKPSSPTQWVDLYGDYLYRFALMRVRNHEVAENMVQETFLAALKARDNFAGKSTERTWLTGILKNKIIDHFRKSSRDILASEIQGDAHSIDQFFDAIGHFNNAPQQWDFNPKEMLQKEEFWATFRSCLTKLPEATASVFVMREIDKIDSKTICKEWGITSSNLWVMLHRARLQLRACLERNWFKEEEKS